MTGWRGRVRWGLNDPPIKNVDAFFPEKMNKQLKLYPKKKL